MRIDVDPIHAPPSHALTRNEVKELVALVPQEWIRFIRTIHLSATLPDNSRFARPVIYSAYSNRLNVCSRGMEPEQTRLEILRELARRGLSIQPSKGNNLSHQQLKEIDEVVSPLLKQVKSSEAEASSA